MLLIVPLISPAPEDPSASPEELPTVLAVTWLFAMTSLLSMKSWGFTETSMSLCTPAESETASPTELVIHR